MQPIKMQAVDRHLFVDTSWPTLLNQCKLQTLLLCAAACTCVLNVYITLISNASIPRTFLHKTHCGSGPSVLWGPGVVVVVL